jgi:hypothetical protein
MTSTNGDGSHADEEHDLLVIALRAAREQAEAGEVVIEWAPPVVRFIRALAAREAERYPPGPMQEEVERAVTCGAAYMLSVAVKFWFSPELAR